jgi:hypothetical protein
MKRVILRDPPLCACGCGLPVKLIWGRNAWNKFLQGHFIRSVAWHDNMSKAKKEHFKLFANPMEGKHHTAEANNSNREKHIKRHIIRPATAPKCACGCGLDVTRSRNCWWKWNVFIKGHSARMPATRAKESATCKKHVKSEWHRRNIGLANLGRKDTPDTIERKRKSSYMKVHTADKSPFWQGGVSKLPYSFDFTTELKITIKQRDGFCCQRPECSDKYKPLVIHHIDYNKKNCAPSNLISLCRKCHGKNKQQ